MAGIGGGMTGAGGSLVRRLKRKIAKPGGGRKKRVETRRVQWTRRCSAGAAAAKPGPVRGTQRQQRQQRQSSAIRGVDAGQASRVLSRSAYTSPTISISLSALLLGRSYCPLSSAFSLLSSVITCHSIVSSLESSQVAVDESSLPVTSHNASLKRIPGVEDAMADVQGCEPDRHGQDNWHTGHSQVVHRV